MFDVQAQEIEQFPEMVVDDGEILEVIKIKVQVSSVGLCEIVLERFQFEEIRAILKKIASISLIAAFKPDSVILHQRNLFINRDGRPSHAVSPHKNQWARILSNAAHLEESTRALHPFVQTAIILRRWPDRNARVTHR